MYLVRIGVVEVLPVNRASLTSGKRLEFFRIFPQQRTSSNLSFSTLDSNIEQEHDGVCTNVLNTENVTTSLSAVLSKDSRNGLEHALRDEVRVRSSRLPLVDKFFVTINNVLEDCGVVLEVHGEPDIT